MVYEFYACLSREVQETGGKQRTGLEFEVVEVSCLDCFLEERANTRIMASSEYCEIFRLYQEYGVMDEQFRKEKGRYLGETGFSLVTVYFESMEYTKYRYEHWYLIRLSDDGRGLRGDIYESSYYEWGETGDPKINGRCNLEVLPEAQAKMLRQLYTPYIPEESRMFGQDSQNNVGVIQAATVFGEVDFLYVGAALCVGILDQHGNLAAIFDLGTRVSNNPALAAQHPAAANSRAVIMAALNAIAPNNRQTIFISHWHTDHCNALGGLAHQGGFGNANFNQNSEWYVPASGSISYTTVQNAIPAASFHVFAQGVIQPTAAVNGNVNISVGKISLQNNAHPHHQGLYVKLQLTSGTDVFLAGDTTYEGIPAATRTNGGAGYDVLQACHHGGAYYLPPANQNAAVAQGNIPTAANGATVVYSADGIYHGHPNAVYMGHHQNQGYAAAVRLDQIALTGNNVQFFQ